MRDVAPSSISHEQFQATESHTVVSNYNRLLTTSFLYLYSTMLTKEESLQFIQTTLKIQDPEQKFEKNGGDFLNDLICSIQRIPFQCVTLVDKPLEHRRRPTAEEVKTSMLEGKGGLCYAFNLFIFYLLKSLSYDVHLNRCQCPHAERLCDNHLIVLAYHVRKPGDIYLVEAGCASPCFEAINLDFECESPVYHASFLQYKFVKCGNKIQRFHDRSGFELSPGQQTKTEPFELFYEFEINPTNDLEGIYKYFDKIYTAPELSAFHKSLRAVKFVDRKMVVICNWKLALESDAGEIHVTNLTSVMELEQAYRRYFPEIDETSVKKAIYNWTNDIYD